MSVRALLLDPSDLLLEIDWSRYQDDQASAFLGEAIEPYEQINQGLLQALKDLRRDYILLAVCNQTVYEKLNRRFLLQHLFAELLIEEVEGLSRNDKALYQRALNRLELSPQQVLFVSATIEHILLARQLGLTTIHAVRPRQLLRELQAALAGSSV